MKGSSSVCCGEVDLFKMTLDRDSTTTLQTRQEYTNYFVVDATLGTKYVGIFIPQCAAIVYGCLW